MSKAMARIGVIDHDLLAGQQQFGALRNHSMCVRWAPFKDQTFQRIPRAQQKRAHHHSYFMVSGAVA